MNTIHNIPIPLHMFDNPNPFQRASKVQSQPITPIELPPDRGFQYSGVLNMDRRHRRNSLYDPLLLADSYAQSYNPSIDPSALHYGVLPGGHAPSFISSPVGLPVGRPNYAGSSLTSYNPPGGTPYSRRVEPFPASHSHSKSLGQSAASPSSEPYFCRTPNATLRQRTAQACEKCRDRKTKACPRSVSISNAADLCCFSAPAIVRFASAVATAV